VLLDAEANLCGNVRKSPQRLRLKQLDLQDGP